MIKELTLCVAAKTKKIGKTQPFNEWLIQFVWAQGKWMPCLENYKDEKIEDYPFKKFYDADDWTKEIKEP